MHAQTILQLYRQLIDAGYQQLELAQVRSAYELACQLFVGCFRPSEKPFCAHLVGTASALARWKERKEMVIAGLLHSAYLYGEFGDGTRGISPAKQRVVVRCAGSPAESLIQRYTLSDGQREKQCGRANTGAADRDVLVLKMADVCDEYADAGPLYSPKKLIAGGAFNDLASRNVLLRSAEELVGPVARDDLDRALRELDAFHIPAVLATGRSAYHTIQPGVPGLRTSRTKRRLLRIGRRLSLCR